jgi:hypothetical protein
MNRKVLKIDDLSPDDIKIVVDWEGLLVGSSAFIPCINTEKAHQQIKNVGVRLWRIT